MGKKLNAKERRELEKARKKEQGNKINTEHKERAEEEKRKEEEKKEKIKEAARKKREDDYIEKVNPDMKKSKSDAKAAGLKSALILNENTILTTSFGKGNKAKLEEYVIGLETKAVDESQRPLVSVEKAGEMSLKLRGFKNNEATISNPLYVKKGGNEKANQPGMDMIKCKPQLEKMYFGKTFEDNIHIQLIYNILDIEKILTVHVNDIVYMMNNLRRSDREENDDIIGCLGEKNYEDFKNKEVEKYEKFAQLVNSPQLRYLGGFFVPKEEKKRRVESQEAFEKRIYDILRILCWVRQAVAHGNQAARNFLYRLDKEGIGGKNRDAKEMLDKLYFEKVTELNAGFWSNSRKDIAYLIQLYPEDKEIPEKYYDFVVKKSYKNKGFSVKHLREMLIEEKAKFISGDDRKSIRQKLNRYLDFSIHYAYEEDEAHLNDFVEDLRTCQAKGEKERRYYQELEWLLPENQNSRKIKIEELERLNGNYFKDASNDGKASNRAQYAIDESSLIPEKATAFSEIIYVLTFFLDGKEINDLLTQLINKMDNISGFIDIMKSQNIDCSFVNHYKVLENQSKDIANELRIINSFARMSQPDPSAAKVMYEEAIKLLGFQDDDLSDYLEKEVLTKAKGMMGFRNFVSKNVIQSSRFIYLVRYADPESVRKLANNEKVVSFVLKKIPDAQIESFYKSCNEKAIPCPYESMRSNLCEKITNLDFKEFESTKSSEKEKGKKRYEENKERKKNIVRLYLTVLYLLVKNLVYVNSRYFLAFHCAERDASFGGGGGLGENGEDVSFHLGNIWNEGKEGWMVYAKAFVEKNSKNWRARVYLKQNFENADEWALAKFRNCTEHLNAIRNADKYIDDIREFKSYFELYHYIVQRWMQEEYDKEVKNHPNKVKPEEHKKLEEYFEYVSQKGTYRKDFVKALCVPFAYNLARFKNLSIEALFDRNNYLPEEAKGEWHKGSFDRKKKE